MKQIIAYAVVKGRCHAVLVYPAPLLRPLDAVLEGDGGRLHVQSATFDLAGDLEAAGRRLVASIAR